jgi:cell division septum initiation protein DivIVA
MEKFRLTHPEDRDETASEGGSAAFGDQNASAGSDPAPAAEHKSALDRFGAHVSSVLGAATEAAVRIQEEAREEAESTRAEAQQVRADTEEWADRTRAEADAYAADRRTEAQAEARAIVEEAERKAESVSDDAERRRQALITDLSLAEGRLRQLATGLREVAGRLDELLESPPGSETVVSEVDDGSLVEALLPLRDGEEAPM